MSYHARTASLLVLMIVLAGCSHMSKLWPWRAKPPAPPEVAHELVITAGEGVAASYPQYWKRNTVVVDLQGVAGTGSIVLRRREGATWPVRIALRVMPGSVGVLDIAAAQRLVLPISPDGAQPVDLELPPGAYTPATEEITVRWSPATPATS
jgi:hypothetical protein